LQATTLAFSTDEIGKQLPNGERCFRPDGAANFFGISGGTGFLSVTCVTLFAATIVTIFCYYISD
jgi:hypothetical protein